MTYIEGIKKHCAALGINGVTDDMASRLYRAFPSAWYGLFIYGERIGSELIVRELQ